MLVDEKERNKPELRVLLHYPLRVRNILANIRYLAIGWRLLYLTISSRCLPSQVLLSEISIIPTKKLIQG